MNNPKETIDNTASLVVDNFGQILLNEDVLDVVRYGIEQFDDEINLGKEMTKSGNPIAKAVLELTIGAQDRDGDNVYHIRQDWIQSYAPAGYNNVYDAIFNAAISATGNTMDRKKSAEFTVDGETYIIWAWKGDYMNLGAGAETGIYRKYSDTHYLTATDKATDMELTLTSSSKGELFNYKPYGDTNLWNNGAQWWVNGFDSQYQNVRADDLIATTVIDFSKMQNGIEMYNAFKKATLNSEKPSLKTGWTFSEDYKVTLRW